MYINKIQSRITEESIRQRCSLLLLLINTVLEFQLEQSCKKMKEKESEMLRTKVKLSLTADDITY